LVINKLIISGIARILSFDNTRASI
jgi:hypothetical protein